MKVFSRLTRFSDVGLLILRLGIAIIFFAHGMMKTSVWSMQPSEQLPASMLTILKFLSIAEPLGAVAMVLGFWSQLAGLCMSVLMILVINMKITMMHAGFIGEQTTGWELDFIMLCGALCMLFTGPGKISLERFFSKEQPHS